jgi:hypothetical protein
MPPCHTRDFRLLPAPVSEQLETDHTCGRLQHFFIPFNPSGHEKPSPEPEEKVSVHTVSRPTFRSRHKRNRKVVGMKKQFIYQE